jgi:hypothetical protein
LEFLSLSINLIDTYGDVLGCVDDGKRLAHVSRNEPRAVVNLDHPNVVAFEIAEGWKKGCLNLSRHQEGAPQQHIAIFFGPNPANISAP